MNAPIVTSACCLSAGTALERIKEDSFGWCDDSGEAIGLKRLLISPTTGYCIEAQERHEHRTSTSVKPECLTRRGRTAPVVFAPASIRFAARPGLVKPVQQSPALSGSLPVKHLIAARHFLRVADLIEGAIHGDSSNTKRVLRVGVFLMAPPITTHSASGQAQMAQGLVESDSSYANATTNIAALYQHYPAQ